MRISRKAAIIGVVVLVPTFTGAFILQSQAERGGAQLLDQVLGLVSDRFVDTLPTSDLYEKAARGLVKELNDPYSELFSPKKLKQFQTTTGGHYGGIGMLIEQQDKQIVVSKVYPNTPGEAAGVREGDHIIQVDTLPTTNWTIQRVSDYLTGTPGTRVSVRLARPGVATPIDLKLTRAVIHIPAVAYTLMLLPVSLLPTLMGMSGRIYFVGAIVLGLLFLYSSLRAAFSMSRQHARRLLLASVLYLPLLFILMVLNT